MTVSPHALDAAVALTPAGAHRFTGHTHPAYSNMVGPFGGTIAATLLNGVLSHPERLGDPLSLTVHYAAPITDGAFEVQDAASQLAAVALAAEAGHVIVDLCAGAGGKTLAIASAINDEAAILACDTNRARLQQLPPRANRAVVRIRGEGTAAEVNYRLTPELIVRPGDTLHIGERFF